MAFCNWYMASSRRALGTCSSVLMLCMVVQASFFCFTAARELIVIF